MEFTELFEEYIQDELDGLGLISVNNIKTHKIVFNDELLHIGHDFLHIDLKYGLDFGVI